MAKADLTLKNQCGCCRDDIVKPSYGALGAFSVFSCLSDSTAHRWSVCIQPLSVCLIPSREILTPTPARQTRRPPT
ncbi:hypothetical protein BV22DRAFT_1040902 [Leucogyrophana mollusca]|uniref:Uncharacterized protein n=1 Tax=Leucogyrophana mollusca TaxID=85980 RepID=A0ACB8B2T4_9AGAM|nr:hypothetical protein BV22DRAFT_1040902 [Leucogyrophana mollusca]